MECSLNRDTMPGAKFYDGKKIAIPISAASELDLVEHWTLQAVSSLMSAFASKHTERLEGSDKERFTNCSKGAKTINKQAYCIMDAIAASKKREVKKPTVKEWAFVTATYDDEQPPLIPLKKSTKLEILKQKYQKLYRKYRLNRFKIRKQRHLLIRRLDPQSKSELDTRATEISGEQEKNGQVIVVHHTDEEENVPKIIQREEYKLLTDNSIRTPVGILMKYMTRTLRRIKNKPDDRSWQSTILKIKQLGEMLHKDEEQLPKRKEDLNSGPISSDANAVTKQLLSRIQSDFGAGVFDKMPSSLKSKVMEAAVVKKKRQPNTVLLLRNAIKLGMALTGQNTSDFDEKTVKLVSPRLLSVVPDDNADIINLLSPSLFSLHDGGNDVERLLSIPNLIKATRIMQKKDQDEMLNLIAEASGVSDVVETINDVELPKKEEETLHTARGIDGQPMYFTKENATEIYGDNAVQKIDTFESLHRNLTQQQLKEMNMTGYSLLNPKQLQLLYGEDSPYHLPDALERFLNVTDEQGLHGLVEHDLELLKNSKEAKLQLKTTRRSKRTVTLSPIVLTPLILTPSTLSQMVVLSPVLLSPVILSPAVLGPFILSPWLFVPVIVAPRVLSPIILSPLAFSPVILTPLVLHPFILSPGIFNPFVLSPSVLTPFILSPQVATPFILSPMVLNPLILNPMALSPLILSPFVLSPIILSPQFIFALVLSPHALSPLVMSNLSVSAVVASPSFLS